MSESERRDGSELMRILEILCVKRAEECILTVLSSNSSASSPPTVDTERKQRKKRRKKDEPRAHR